MKTFCVHVSQKAWRDRERESALNRHKDTPWNDVWWSTRSRMWINHARSSNHPLSKVSVSVLLLLFCLLSYNDHMLFSETDLVGFDMGRTLVHTAPTYLTILCSKKPITSPSNEKKNIWFAIFSSNMYLNYREGKLEDIFFSILVCIPKREKKFSKGLSALSTKESPFLCKLHLFNGICSPKSLMVCTVICLICRYYRRYEKCRYVRLRVLFVCSFFLLLIIIMM